MQKDVSHTRLITLANEGYEGCVIRHDRIGTSSVCGEGGASPGGGVEDYKVSGGVQVEDKAPVCRDAGSERSDRGRGGRHSGPDIHQGGFL